MKIAYLGSGAWGFCLANLLAANGHQVFVWTTQKELAQSLNGGGTHPKLEGIAKHDNVTLTTSMETAVADAELIVESVTSKGLRSVLNQLKELGIFSIPIVLTSKGIEQDTQLLLGEVVEDVMGDTFRDQIACLSGPSLADEVIKKIPTSVVSAAYDPKLMLLVRDIFTTPYFRVYPNSDVAGVSFGGAMKNIIAIACGFSDGMGYGSNTKAALMTRGLHEIRKLSVTKGCKKETLNGLSGMGDLCVTCLSVLSRNYRFGMNLAKGMSIDDARQTIGMVVEGAYTCLSALQLARKANIAVPITESIASIIYEELDPQAAVHALLNREVKEEHL